MLALFLNNKVTFWVVKKGIDMKSSKQYLAIFKNEFFHKENVSFTSMRFANGLRFYLACNKQ